MKSTDYWHIILETGAPEAYLSYTRALKMEANHVPEDPGPGTAGHGLQ